MALTLLLIPVLPADRANSFAGLPANPLHGQRQQNKLAQDVVQFHAVAFIETHFGFAAIDLFFVAVSFGHRPIIQREIGIDGEARRLQAPVTIGGHFNGHVAGYLNFGVRSQHQLGFSLRAERAGLVQIGIFILRSQLKINVPRRDFDIETTSADIQVPKMKEHGELLPRGTHSGVPGRTEQSISISRCWEGCLHSPADCIKLPESDVFRSTAAQCLITTTRKGQLDEYAVSAGTGEEISMRGSIGILAIAILTWPGVSQGQGTITTSAGNGSFTSSGDGGPASSAGIGFPAGVAVDGAGNIYIADALNSRVRKVNTAGVITTVAGNGFPFFGGDGGPGSSASIALCGVAPHQGVATDSLGNLYIADCINNRIRKVDTSGIISTVAGSSSAANFSGDGGPATSATLSVPYGVTVDAAGNIYIADTGNGRIRKVNTAGIISTVAGSGNGSAAGDGGPATSAKLANPSDVAVDSAGNMYIADFGNSLIRKVNTAGTISTLAHGGFGNCQVGVSLSLANADIGAGAGIGLDSAGNLYIADHFSNCIHKVSKAGIVTTVAGGGSNIPGDGGPATSAGLGNLTDVDVDAAGNIFLSDVNESRVRKVIAPPACTYILGATTLQPPAAGGNFPITIQTAAGCAWSVTGLPPWITVSGPSSGTGSGSVTLVVAPTTAFRGTVLSIGGVALTINQSAPPVCTYALSAGGQAFTAVGGSGTIAITAPAGCNWSVGSLPAGVTLSGASSGAGNGTVTFLVAPIGGGDISMSFTVAGQSFTVEQQAASIVGLNFIGSMPHIAAQENWTTLFTLVNKGGASAQGRLSMFGDAIDLTGNGPLMVPLAFPQQGAGSGPLLASSFDRTIAANASLIVTSAGAQTPPVLVGSAQLAATGAVDGFAIFHLIPGAQEAVVPLETRNASSYLLAFDITGGVVLGVAVQNVSAQSAVISVVIRDENGVVISAPGTTISLPGNGHTSFGLSDQYPVTLNKHGTIEFDTPVGGRISVLGIRTTPLGSSKTLTTIPALANVGINGGSIAHIASGNGWQTTFVLVNTGTTAAQVNLNFFADVTGAPLSLPLSFPLLGGGAATVDNHVSQSLAAGATLLVQSAAPLLDPTPTIGSAQLTTNGHVGGFVIFRYNPNGQEAVVPLESRTAGGYIIAFDNTSSTATGIAINSVSTQAVNVPVIVRNDAGVPIATDTLNLAANGHLAFTLVSDKYSVTQNIRGTIEFDTPAGAQIGALGIRIPVAHTFTTLPALGK